MTKTLLYQQQAACHFRTAESQFPDEFKALPNRFTGIEGRKASKKLDPLQDGREDPVAQGVSGGDGIEPCERGEKRFARVQLVALKDGCPQLFQGMYRNGSGPVIPCDSCQAGEPEI